MQPQEAVEILDSGRAWRGGNPPATIRYGGRDLPNPAKDAPPQTHLGAAQKAWFLDRLRRSTAAWKIWGHSFGTLVWRTDIQNLAQWQGPTWPGSGYALLNGGFFAERAEICDMVRREGITGFAVVAGDKHSFWAGLVSKDLPPAPFDPVGVEFVTGSISSQGLFEVAEQVIPRTDPMRALFVQDRFDGTTAPAINMTVLHGVRSSLALTRVGGIAGALALRNPQLAPHLSFADLAGHGYATVTATADLMETEFVCIPRPLERSGTADGGPISYRVIHRVKLWTRGQPPQLEQEIVEGVPPLANLTTWRSLATSRSTDRSRELRVHSAGARGAQLLAFVDGSVQRNGNLAVAAHEILPRNFPSVPSSLLGQLEPDGRQRQRVSLAVYLNFPFQVFFELGRHGCPLVSEGRQHARGTPQLPNGTNLRTKVTRECDRRPRC